MAAWALGQLEDRQAIAPLGMVLGVSLAGDSQFRPRSRCICS
jgi:hypothetical protein